MHEGATTKRRSKGAFVGVGSGLGSMVSVLTGDWYWMPVILSACIVISTSVPRTKSVRDL